MAEAASTARDLAAAPPNLATPEFLAERAQTSRDATAWSAGSSSPRRWSELGMGALLAVGAGQRATRPA